MNQVEDQSPSFFCSSAWTLSCKYFCSTLTLTHFLKVPVIWAWRVFSCWSDSVPAHYLCFVSAGWFPSSYWRCCLTSFLQLSHPKVWKEWHFWYVSLSIQLFISRILSRSAPVLPLYSFISYSLVPYLAAVLIDWNIYASCMLFLSLSRADVYELKFIKITNSYQLSQKRLIHQHSHLDLL